MARKTLTKKEVEATGGLFVLGGVFYLLTLAFEALKSIFYPLTFIYIGSIFTGLFYYIFFGRARLPKWRTLYFTAREELRIREARLFQVKANYSDIRITNKGFYDERSYRGKDANIEVPQAENAYNKALEGMNGALSPFKTYYMLLTCAWVFLIATFLLSVCMDYSTVTNLAWAQLASLAGGLIVRGGVDAQACAQKVELEREATAISKTALLLAVGAMVFGCAVFVIKPAEQDNTHSSVEVTTSTQADLSGQMPPKPEPVVNLWTKPKNGFVMHAVDARKNLADQDNYVTLTQGSELLLEGETPDKQWFQARLSDGRVYFVPAVAIGIFSVPSP